MTGRVASTLERRAVLRGAAAWALGVGGLVVVDVRRVFPAPARVRPPTATPAFAARCIRCARCTEVCPPGCLVLDDSLDPRLHGLPHVAVETRACTLCMACGDVCPTGALAPRSAALDDVRGAVAMGLARIDRARCRTWSGRGACRACVLACPLPDEAITLTGVGLAPVVRDAACLGCGLCAEACPPDARAIHVEPA